MDLGLEGRRALVNAASRGLGRACAEALVGEGARVFLSSRHEAELRATADAIGATGWMQADVSSEADITRLVGAAVEALGGLDILVVNAGGPPPGTFLSTDEKAWERGWHLTLMSAVRLVRAALPHLEHSDQGRIVNVTSISVRQPIRNLVLSNAYRSAVTAMSKTLSFEVAPKGITVNNIAPDAVLTDRIRHVQADAAQRAGTTLEEQMRRYAEGVPRGRFGEPAEVGWLCAFLCSSRAGFITGQTVGIDGGMLLGVH
jgi:3-oxoacyl-[acyl-carrier protein] reductase